MKRESYCVIFMNAKSEFRLADTTPGLWIGTNNGTVIAMNVNLPGSERASQPVVVSHSGMISCNPLILCLALECFYLLCETNAEIASWIKITGW